MDKCDVLIWGKKFGELSYNNFHLIFRYTTTPPFEVSPLHLSTQNTYYDYTHLESQKHLAGVFADSLPDNYGQKAISTYFSSIGQEANEIDKLLFIGDRTMGAITYSPAVEDHEAFEQTMTIRELHDSVREVISENHLIDTDIGVHILKSVSPVGGAKPKALIGFKSLEEPIYVGPRNGDMPNGYVPSIIKLATGEEGATQDHLRMEYAYMNLAADCGITIPPIAVTPEGHFVISRFDRDNGEKIHMHTLQGLIHSDFKVPRTVDYEEAFRMMVMLGCPKGDFEQLYRRMAFNYLLRNHDDHEKNISFLMNRRGEWRISPAYDLGYNYKPGGQFIGDHQLTFNGRVGNEVAKRDFVELAERFGVTNYDDIIHTIESARSDLAERLATAGVNEKFFAEIVVRVNERSITNG